MAKAPEVKGEVVEKPIEAIKAIDTMTMQEYQAWLASENAIVSEFDGGSEWTITDKTALIGVPFLIAGFQWNETSKGNFMSVRCFLSDGTKIVFNDGGTGIPQQLRNYEATHKRSTGIMCKQGLRVSDYDYIDDDGVKRPAQTYYIA